MMKHLFWYPWVMAALVLGILICLGLIGHMLFFRPQQPGISAGAQFVMEGIRYAAA